MPRVLILGGTTEASGLCRALSADARFETILSFAGATRAPRLPDLLRVTCRIGGFGGVAGLVDFLHAERIEAMIDATHPFAAQMSRNAAEAGRIGKVAHLGIARPAWQAGPGDRWTEVAGMTAAAAALGPDRRRVLLTVGQKELSPFLAAPWHHYVLRSVDPPAVVPPDCERIAARGPFRPEDEMSLLADRRIDVIVTKNSGGTATEAKLAAARQLGIPVILVARPAAPACASVGTVAAALAWLSHHAGTPRGV